MILIFLSLLLAFLAAFVLILGLMPVSFESRPTLQLDIERGDDIMPSTVQEKKKKHPFEFTLSLVRKISLFNAPLASSGMGQRIARDLAIARSSFTVEEFLLIKEAVIICCFAVVIKFFHTSDLFLFFMLLSFAAGFMGPEFMLKRRIKRIKNSIIRTLPDTVDLLGLCVNAGLDFMMALKYMIEKSAPSIITEELNNMMQEIKLGKPRRDALRDLSKKYDLPDLSTFSRTLIQADRMGTSVIEALNILSEDMRESRFRRGEEMALKAPLKMLVPLLFFIFPVVAILVAGPVFLEFFQHNPLSGLGR